MTDRQVAEQNETPRTTEPPKPDFYCWDCDRRFTLPGDGYPPQSGIVQCKRCASMEVFWLRPQTKDAERVTT